MHKNPKIAGIAGFTLIELLTVIAILSILMVILVPRVIEAQDAAKVTACQKNLQEIYSGLTLLDSRPGGDTKITDEAGVRYFLKIWKYEQWERVENSARKLICPGVKPSTLAGLKGREYEQWFDDWDALDGSYSSYAGRDIKNYPLRNWKTGTEPLVADDNDGGMNHRLVTNVLMGDGSVKQFDLVFLKQDGVVEKEATFLPVGSDSPVEILRKFSLD